MSRVPPSLADVPSYAVNLESRPERWWQTVEHLAEMGMRAPVRWLAVDGKATTTPEELARYQARPKRGPDCRAACLGHNKSFTSLVRYLLDEGPAPWTLFLEDDVLFAEDLHPRWEKFAGLVPDDAWMVLVGGKHPHPSHPVDPEGRVWRVNHAYATHAFLVSAEGMPVLWDVTKDMVHSFDVSWNDMHRMNRTYCPDPFLAFQRDGFSDITGRTVRHGKNMLGPGADGRGGEGL
ncbi:hypothetical protein [Streptomyces chilikensis]|uniref:Glycosyltransferase n=1 Tax=Streptomyces chilikensis TaxID=1194079 RepID=A0ABV3EJA4_9ACTN